MKRAERRAKTKRFIKRQLKIAKRFGLKLTPGKFKKKHALDCGNPKCLICGNPRKLWKRIPTKEQIMKEDMEMDIEMD